MEILTVSRRGDAVEPAQPWAGGCLDLDGEAHRYYTAAKRWEFAHGGTTRQALAIGRALAAEPA